MGGCNVILEKLYKLANGYIWFLNNDTLVEKNTLPKLKKILNSDEKCAIVSSTLIDGYDRKSVQSIGAGKIIFPWMITRQVLNYKNSFDYITGTSLLVKIKTSRNIGYFPADFFFILKM